MFCYTLSNLMYVIIYVMDKLTLKQEKFVQEYLSNGGNATQAYKVAYDGNKNSDKTNNENASRMLANSKIKARLNEYQEKAQETVLYTAEKSFNKLNELLALALCPEGESGRINLQAALKAEELKGRLVGLYTEHVEAKVGELPVIKDDV